MIKKKIITNEAKKYCPTELNTYMKKYTDLTSDEKKGLHNWVVNGYSIYDNPYDICDEHGVTMDYINAIRVYDETILDEYMNEQNDYYQQIKSSDLEFELFHGYSGQPRITSHPKHCCSLCKSTCYTTWLGNVRLCNGNGVPFSIKTQVNRRDAINGITLYLSYIRDAERRDLNNTPEDMQETDEFEAGEYAVDAIEEIIDLLVDVY
jgi:hypothetical protein